MNERTRREKRDLFKRRTAPHRAQAVLEKAEQSGNGEPFPAWVYGEVAEAEAKASAGTLPVAVFRKDGASAGDALVVMRLETFIQHVEARGIGGFAKSNEAGE